MTKAKAETEPKMPDFKGKLGWDNQFKKVIDIAGRLVNYATLKFTEEGIRIKQTFTNQTGLMDMTIDKKDFEEYKIKKPFDITTDLSELLNILKLAGRYPHIEIDKDRITTKEVDEKNPKTFTITATIGEMDREDELKEENLNLDFTKTIKIQSDDLKEILTKTENFFGKEQYGDGQSLSFDINNIWLTISAGDTDKNAEFKVALTERLGKNQKVEPSIISNFGQKWLKDIMRASKLKNEAILSFGNDQPMKAEFCNGTAKAKFILANMVRG